MHITERLPIFSYLEPFIRIHCLNVLYYCTPSRCFYNVSQTSHPICNKKFYWVVGCALYRDAHYRISNPKQRFLSDIKIRNKLQEVLAQLITMHEHFYWTFFLSFAAWRFCKQASLCVIATFCWFACAWLIMWSAVRAITGRHLEALNILHCNKQLLD